MGFARGLLSTTTPAADLRAAIEALLPASGWVLEDTYTGTAPADSVRVWMNPAANNVSGINFYVALGITAASATSFWIGMAEIYDPATKLARKYVPNSPSSSTNYTIDADFTILDATGKAFEAGSINSGVPTVWKRAIVLPTTGSGYAVSVTKDYVAFNALSNLNTGEFWFAGRFVKDTTYAADRCLIACYNAPATTISSFAGSSFGASTQFPGHPTNGSASGSSLAIGPTTDGFNGGAYLDLLNGNKPYTTRLAIGDARGYYRGYLRDLLFLPAQFTNYDDDITLTISGTQFTYGRLTSQVYANKAAV